jgi:hypothetical protein
MILVSSVVRGVYCSYREVNNPKRVVSRLFTLVFNSTSEFRLVRFSIFDRFVSEEF